MTLRINPRELSHGAVLISSGGAEDPVRVSTRTQELAGDEGDSRPPPAALEYLLAGLGLSLHEVIEAAIARHEIDVSSLHVAVSLTPTEDSEGDQAPSVTRELVVGGQLADEQVGLLKEAIKSCPVAQLLEPALVVRDVVHWREA